MTLPGVAWSQGRDGNSCPSGYQCGIHPLLHFGVCGPWKSYLFCWVLRTNRWVGQIDLLTGRWVSALTTFLISPHLRENVHTSPHMLVWDLQEADTGTKSITKCILEWHHSSFYAQNCYCHFISVPCAWKPWIFLPLYKDIVDNWMFDYRKVISFTFC